MSDHEYDLVVIGAGAGGLTASAWAPSAQGRLDRYAALYENLVLVVMPGSAAERS